MKKILVINGPNLDMLGKRDRAQYGSFTLGELEGYVSEFSTKLGVEVSFFQSAYEGAIVDKLHEKGFDAVALNAGAYTHYSYAIRDAIECAEVPVVEVHISDISKREEWRRTSVIKDVCVASFVGFGKDSYTKAIEYIVEKL